MNKLILFFLAFISISLQASGDNTDILLKKLDNAIEQRDILAKGKENTINRLKHELQTAVGKRNLSEEIRISEALWHEYSAYNTDQALYYAAEMVKASEEAGDKEHVIYGTFHRIESLMTAGMFKEAYDVLQPIRQEARKEQFRALYYHLCRTLFGYMTDYAVSPEERERYKTLTDVYRDSVLSCYPKNSGLYNMMLADKYITLNENQAAIDCLIPVKPSTDLRFNAAYYYTLGEAYYAAEKYHQAFDAYVQSATYDMLSSTREYISLRKVAIMLYKQGDINTAYRYLSICMEDAKLCNARLRIFEILEAFPVINQAYLAKQRQQQYLLVAGLVAISLLALLLFFAFRRMQRQRNATRKMQKELSDANGQLKIANVRLKNAAEELKEQSAQIEESSILKEIYIGRYMDQCSSYLEKLDQFRRHVRKVADYGTKQELKEALKSSTKELEEELSEFYSNFDDTFLGLFPTFVPDFNNLLQEGEAIQVKPGQKMNTELRIFALIRLGITDSVKIAQFLRYSTTTIYNYRTRIRNKAKGNRDELEKKVANIGKVAHEN